MDKADKIAAKLPPAQRAAMMGAKEYSWSNGDLYVGDINFGVRRRLHEKGLLGKRPGHPLTKLGREVQNRLLGFKP